MKTRVIIADAHASVRGLVKLALSQEGGYEVVAETGLGAEALKKCRVCKNSLLIVDPQLPDICGAHLVGEVRRRCASTRVMVYCGAGSHGMTLDVLGAEPHGFAHKSEPLGVFQAVLRGVRDGLIIYSELARRVLNGLKGNGQTHKNGLAPQERAVLRLLASSQSNKEIAGQMRITVKTVMHYRAAIMEKLDIHEVAGLTRYALSAGIVTLDG